MNQSTRTWRRWATALSATVGLAATVIFMPTSARAAIPAPSFTWAFSTYMQSGGQLTPTNPTGGASIDAANQKIVFGSGTGTFDSNTGAADLAYSGSIGFSDTHGGNFYTITFSNPEVTVDASGHGAIVADVSYNVQGVTGGQNDLTLTTFTAHAANWSGNTLTATPAWEHVATDGEYGKADQPVAGASWNPAFVKALPSSVQAFFYASKTGQGSKAPSAFTAVAPAPALTPQVSYSTTSTNPDTGLTLAVNGTGFTAVTNPGDAGIYVGIAPAGGLPNVSSPAGMGAFAGVAYVPVAAINDTAFTVNINAATAKLDPTKTYALYTWQAHTHSNTSQDTETPLTINWAALAETTTPATPQVTYSTTSTNPDTGLTLAVNGTGFTAVTNPGDAGIYVGIAPAGGLPNVSSPAGTVAFAAVGYLSPAAIRDSAFSTTLTAAATKLDPTKTYALYTWQAHTHSNTSQDTETPITIDWAALTDEVAPVKPDPKPEAKPDQPTKPSTPTQQTLSPAPSTTNGTPAAGSDANTATSTTQPDTSEATTDRSTTDEGTDQAEDATVSETSPVQAEANQEQVAQTAAATTSDDEGHPSWPLWVAGILAALAIAVTGSWLLPRLRKGA